MGRLKLAPSLLNADFSDLAGAVSYIEGIADAIHLDVMDGNLVPNITFGPLVVRAIRKITAMPLDVHLMISRPSDFAADFMKAGADWVSFHAEAAPQPARILELIRGHGKRAGMVINPRTPACEIYDFLELMDFILVMTVVPGFGGQEIIPEALDKVGEIKGEAARRGLEIEVEVDGGIKTHNLGMVISSGADIIVVGSSIYASPDPRRAALDIKNMLDEA